MTFEDDVRKWATLDTRLSDINNAAKEVRNERNEVEGSILRHVERNSLNNATVKLSDSRLRFIDSKTHPPLTFKFIKSCLNEIIEDPEEVDGIISYIKNKREPKTSLGIKRYFND